MNRKILVLDIDGTLTNSAKEITPATKKAIIDIQEKGHVVMLASGRPTQGMRRYADELQFERFGGYLLSFNGAKIVNCKSGEIVYQQTLPKTVIPGIHKFALENDMGVCTYIGDKIIAGTRIDEYLTLESRINVMEMEQVRDFVKYSEYDVNKCLMTVTPDRAPELLVTLQEKYSDTLSIYRSEPFFIEVMPKNVDKAASLDKMLPTVGLTKEDAICCGDGYNDLSMIQYAGVGVAMSNAQPEVREAADYVTGSNNEDGLVTVIERFILS